MPSRGVSRSERAGALLLALACAAVGCSSSVKSAGVTRVGALTVTGGFIPAPAAPDVAAAYLTVTNSGSVADSIARVTTNVTSQVTAMQETTSGTVGTMTDLPTVTIPAHGSATFTPGHAHLMLQHPDRRLKLGDRVLVTITFTHAGKVTLVLPVVPVTGPTPGS